MTIIIDENTCEETFDGHRCTKIKGHKDSHLALHGNFKVAWGWSSEKAILNHIVESK